jgi:hypothetical protein
MTPAVIRYPLDPTGVNPNNLIQGEIQNLTANRNVRAIAPNYGAFFTESLIVTDMATNQVLTPSTQYYAAELYELPTDRYGKQICAIILITDPTVSNQVSLQYQTLGGPYGTSATAIIQQIENLQLDTRPVAWGDILGRPSAFPPAFHLHDIGDVYGFEYLVHAVDRVRTAIETNQAGALDLFYSYIDQIFAQFEGSFGSNISSAAIIAGLGFTPMDSRGGVFSGPVIVNGLLTANKGFVLNGYMMESVQSVTVNSASTIMDLSLATAWRMTVSANTLLNFSTANMGPIPAGVTFGFSLTTINDAVGGWAVAFPTNVTWANGAIPPRSLTPNSRDEWYFFTETAGVTWTGSLSNAACA